MGSRIALLVALVTITLFGLGHLYNTDPSVTSVFGGCHFRRMTGLLCPGCGGTRAFHALLHGKVLTALWFNPLLLVALGLFAVLANLVARELLGPKCRLPHLEIPTWLGWTLGALVLLFAILRNVPVWPFHLLGP